MKYFKKITPMGNSLHAEICYKTKSNHEALQEDDGLMIIVVNSKTFTSFMNPAPTQKAYDRANKWLNKQLELYKNNGL